MSSEHIVNANSSRMFLEMLLETGVKKKSFEIECVGISEIWKS